MNMAIFIIERQRKNPYEVRSKIRANNVILNVVSQFESNSPLDELLFRISEQKILKAAHETADCTFAVPSDLLI